MSPMFKGVIFHKVHTNAEFQRFFFDLKFINEHKSLKCTTI